MLRVIWLSSLLFVASLSTISAREFVDSSIRKFGGFSVKTEVKTKLDSLFGEPVLNASFRWNLEIGQYDRVELPAATPNQTTQEYRLEDLDSEARDRVKIFNVIFALVIDRRFEKNFEVGADTECILVDGGAAAEGDGETWSFNVSGSPNWDRLLTNCNSIPGFSIEGHDLKASIDRDNLEYYEPERAKRVYKRLLDGTYGLKEIVPVAGEISYRELEAWFVQKYEPKVVAGKLKALQTLEKGLKESFGLELPKPTTDSIIQDLKKDYYAIEALNKQIATVDRRIEKLSDLPAEFMVGREQYASAYERSVRESRLVLQTASANHNAWTSNLPTLEQNETTATTKGCTPLDEHVCPPFVNSSANSDKFTFFRHDESYMNSQLRSLYFVVERNWLWSTVPEYAEKPRQEQDCHPSAVLKGGGHHMYFDVEFIRAEFLVNGERIADQTLSSYDPYLRDGERFAIFAFGLEGSLAEISDDSLGFADYPYWEDSEGLMQRDDICLMPFSQAFDREINQYFPRGADARIAISVLVGGSDSGVWTPVINMPLIIRGAP